jgi:hypothetical protein
VITLLTALVAPSLFADYRHEKTTDRWRDRDRDGRRVVVEGRIRDIDRERNGFVIRLDRGETLFLPVQTRGSRRLEHGDFIRVSGHSDGRGHVYVERITLVREDDDRHLSGIVQRVDRRGDIVWLQLERGGRIVAVDMRRVNRNHRQYDADDLRGGDRISVRGEWRRDGRFEADSFDLDRGAWW